MDKRKVGHRHNCGDAVRAAGEAGGTDPDAKEAAREILAAIEADVNSRGLVGKHRDDEITRRVNLLIETNREARETNR